MHLSTYHLFAAVISGILFISGLGALAFVDTLELLNSAASVFAPSTSTLSAPQNIVIDLGIIFTSLMTCTLLVSAVWQMMLGRRAKRVANAQASQNEQFRAAVLDAIPSEIAVLDHLGKIVAVNEAWLNFGRKFNHSAKPIPGVGADYLAVTRAAAEAGDPSAQQALAGITAVMEGRAKIFQMEYPCTLTGENGCFLMHAVAGPPSTCGAIITHIDITAGRNAERALRDNEELLRTMIASIPDVVQVKDANGRWVLANDAALRYFQIEHLDWQGKTDAEIHALTPRKTTRDGIQDQAIEKQVWQERRPIRVIEVVPDGNAASRYFDIIKSPLWDEADQAKHLVVVGRDITQQKLAEDTLRKLSAELEARVAERTAKLECAMEELRLEIAGRLKLEQQILKISEQEQMRIGQDLHDDLGQQLVGVAILADLLAKGLADEVHPRAASAAKLSNFLNTSIDTTRSLARAFYPVELERGGLALALQDLAIRSQQVAGIRCSVQMDPAFSVAKPFEIHLYRIVQESITNALKHGLASEVRIDCQTRERRQSVTVTSNGKRFEPSGKGTQTGMGLHLFHYRARLIGAQITVSPGEDGGCVVTCAIEDAAELTSQTMIS